MASFTVRVDEALLTRFDQAAEESGTKREPLVRQLMERWLERGDEQYYTIKAYGEGHSKWAYIHNLDGMVNWNQDGIEYNSPDWKRLEHAIDLAERGQSGDKEQVIALLGEIFGKDNVFLKEEL